MSSSKNNIYGNFVMISPSGDFLCRCNEEKVHWYLDRNLAELLEDKNTIKLKFTPKGNGKKDDIFYTQERKNECCVCGNKNNLSKHHVVPYCFRKYFPKGVKSHSSHDILPMCRDCHDGYEKHAYKLKLELSKQYNCSMRGNGIVIDKTLNKITSAAIELLKNSISKKRKKKLKRIVLKYLNKKEIPYKKLYRTIISIINILKFKNLRF